MTTTAYNPNRVPDLPMPAKCPECGATWSPPRTVCHACAGGATPEPQTPEGSWLKDLLKSLDDARIEPPLDGPTGFTVTFDPSAQAAYISFETGEPSYTRELSSAVLLDIGFNSGRVTGIELLDCPALGALAENFKALSQLRFPAPKPNHTP